MPDIFPLAIRALRFFHKQGRLFLLALGFLTRLGPALPASPQELGAASMHYPLVGAVLGAALTLPFTLGLYAHNAWAQAWIYVFLSVWLTRSLHLDGLADILDALGSGRRGDGFQAVLKDSRTGVFGVAGLCIALSGQLLLAEACFASGNLPPLAFAPVYGRSLPIFLACMTPCNPKAGLGALFAASPKARAFCIAAGSALLGGMASLPPGACLLALFPTLALLLFLARLAVREQGFSGDFFGFLITGGELIILFCAGLFF